jgi:photosystem II stability/assembly factor-like uncharacterized protein
MRDYNRSTFLNDPVDNREDMQQRAARYREMLGVDDLDALTDQLLSLRKALRKNDPLARRTYDLRGPLPNSGLQVMPLDPADRVSISKGRRPKSALTFGGQSGRYVKVSAPKPIGFVRLRFALPAHRIKHLYLGTVVAARWDSHLKRLRLIPSSGYSDSGEYVYAQVMRPGLYTAIGLPRDPRLLAILQTLSALKPWAEAARMSDTKVFYSITRTLLERPFLRNFANNKKILDIFGYGQERIHSDITATKLNLHAIDSIIDKLPELDLLEVIDRPSKTIKPIGDLRLPERWPVPSGRLENLGPDNVPGRIKCLAIDPSDGDVLYAGAAGGGVWRTTNGGRDWFATMQREASLAIGCLGVAPSHPNVLYAGTGEWTGDKNRARTPSGMGAGIFRTSDAGHHWELCAPVESFLCTGVAIHPRDPDLVYVSGNRGLHFSKNGGLSWRLVLGLPSEKGVLSETATCVVMDPTEPNRLFVGMHKTGVFISENGGNTWVALTEKSNGLPTGPTANAPKIALGLAGKIGPTAIIVKMGDLIFYSEDGGEHFRKIADLGDRSPGMMPWCSLAAINPKNPKILFAGGTNLHRSSDGGRSWAKVAGYGTSVHEDQQCVIFHPTDPKRVYLGSDGGVLLSRDAGCTWHSLSNGLNAAQCYDVAISHGPAPRYGVTLHDFSAHVFDGSDRWVDLGWGEGGVIEFVPNRSDQVWASSDFTNLTRFSIGADGAWVETENGPNITSFSSQPIALSNSASYTMLVIDAQGSLRRRPQTGNRDIWPLVLESISCVAIAQSDARIAIAGDLSGQIWKSNDTGKTWHKIWTVPDRKEIIHSLSISPTDPNQFCMITKCASKNRVYFCTKRNNLVTSKIIFSNENEKMIRSHFDDIFENRIILFGRSSIRQSIDGGLHWHEAYSGLPKVVNMNFCHQDRSRFSVFASHGRGALLVWDS